MTELMRDLTSVLGSEEAAKEALRWVRKMIKKENREHDAWFKSLKGK